MTHKNRKKVNTFHFLKCWMFSFEGGGISCILNVLNGGLGIRKQPFLTKQRFQILSPVFFLLQFLVIKPPRSRSVSGFSIPPPSSFSTVASYLYNNKFNTCRANRKKVNGQASSELFFMGFTYRNTAYNSIKFLLTPPLLFTSNFRKARTGYSPSTCPAFVLVCRLQIIKILF